MFSKLALVAVFATALIASLVVAQPPNLPCVTWEPLTSDQQTPDPDTLFVAAVGWVMQAQGDPTDCVQRGDLIPCWSNSQSGVVNTWGHHDYNAFYIPSDYCRIWTQDTVYKANNFFIPKKGAQWKTWTWA